MCGDGKQHGAFYVVDGVSLMPLLTQSGKLADRALFWHFPIYLQKYSADDESRDPLFRTRPGSVVRVGDWKLVSARDDEAWELYDLGTDRSETVDLSGQYPQRVQRMEAMWKKADGEFSPSEKAR